MSDTPRQVPDHIAFLANGLAAVFDRHGRQIERYQHGDHAETIRLLAADGIDWRQIPRQDGAPTSFAEPAGPAIREMTEPELHALGNRIGRALSRELPPGSLFVTLYFDDSKFANDVANAVRADIIRVLRETADRLERRQDIPR